MRPRGLLVLTILICLLVVSLVACGGSSNGNKATPTSALGTPGATTTPEASGSGGAGGSTVTMTVGNATAPVGQEGSVEVKAAGVGTPGLGAWTVDVSYDPNIVSAGTCTSASSQGLSFCNAQYASGKIRVVGANAQGLSGDVSLATMTFRCEKAGNSDLDITIDTLADATVGNPTDINHTEQSGSITCS